MFIFQIMYKDMDKKIYFSSGLYFKTVMDVFSWEVMRTIHANMTQIQYGPVGSKTELLEFAGLTRNYKLEEEARERHITYQELEEFENCEMFEYCGLEPELEGMAFEGWDGARLDAVGEFMTKLRRCGSMPKDGRPRYTRKR